MYELIIPMVLNFKYEETYVTLRINITIKEDKPYLLIQLKPLFS